MKKLNFGCGTKIKEGWVNVDIQKAEGIIKSFDFNKYPYPFKENTFNYILIDNVLEHLINPQKVLKELWRISKKNAIIKIIVPYYNSYYAWGDPTHLHFYNEYTLKQTIGQVNYWHEKQKEKFEILKVHSIPQRYVKFMPKKILNILKRIFGNIIIMIEMEIKVLKD